MRRVTIADMANYQTEIAALEAILNAGTSRVSVDGLSTEFDLEAVQRRLTELKRKDQGEIVKGNVRPVASTIRLDSL